MVGTCLTLTLISPVLEKLRHLAQRRLQMRTSLQV
jgi:hypothetical protein